MLIRKARRRAVGAARRLGGYDSPRVQNKPRPARGLVEEFSTGLISGWVAVRTGSPPVRIALWANNVELVATWADGRIQRNGSGDLRGFTLRIKGIWRYLRQTDKLVVKANGRALPISGHGLFLRPEADGTRTLNALKRKLSHGYVLSSRGRVQISRKLNADWQARVLALYDEVAATIRADFGYQVFAMYGTLLGAVREAGFIGHDYDFDSAYLSNRQVGSDAAHELKAIAIGLIERGYRIEALHTHLHIHPADDPQTQIDLFHTYFDSSGVLQFPFGVAGTLDITRSDWDGSTITAPIADQTIAVPTCAEAMVEALYGPQWRKPDPGFRWRTHRRTRASEGFIDRAVREEIYWTDFYARTQYSSGSTFFDFINRRSDTPQYIVDIGCGDGRDALAFAGANRDVLGLDRSELAVQHAAAQATKRDLHHRATFQVCDVSDDTALHAALAGMLTGRPDPVMFYLRFFLHSIPADVQDRLMHLLANLGRSGDVLAAEFRTVADKHNVKVHGNHYRRFQDGPAFGKALATEYCFDIVFEHEGTGLSPYNGEDPVLYRVVARHT